MSMFGLVLTSLVHDQDSKTIKKPGAVIRGLALLLFADR